MHFFCINLFRANRLADQIFYLRQIDRRCICIVSARCHAVFLCRTVLYFFAGLCYISLPDCAIFLCRTVLYFSVIHPGNRLIIGALTHQICQLGKPRGAAVVRKPKQITLGFAPWLGPTTIPPCDDHTNN